MVWMGPDILMLEVLSRVSHVFPLLVDNGKLTVGGRKMNTNI